MYLFSELQQFSSYEPNKFIWNATPNMYISRDFFRENYNDFLIDQYNTLKNTRWRSIPYAAI